MRTIRPASFFTRLALCFLLFVPSALLLRVHGLSLQANLAAWSVVLLSLAAMAWLTASLRNHRALSLTSCILFFFILDFAIRRILVTLFLWPPLASLAPRLPLIQILSTFAAAIAGGLLVTRLGILRAQSAFPPDDYARFVAAAESSLDDFYLFDGIPDATGQIVDFRFSYINPNAERRLNRSRQELLGKVLTEVRPFMLTSGLIERYREVVRTGEPFTNEVYLDDHMVQATWLSVQVIKLGDGIAITSRDITESKLHNDRVKHLAHHDHLTGLPNRTLLGDRLHQAVLRAQRQQHKVAVFMVDIDNFKAINDSLGHATGDALLAAVAERLLSCVRETDTVARIGGDEFVIVMPDFKTVADVERCGREIVEKTSRPIPVEDRELAITLSIGLCLYPDGGLDEDQLLKNADTAMYAVKANGRNGLHLFPGNP